MYYLIIIVFLFGYFLIAMEHPLRIDKAASAILTGVICWTLLMIGKTTILGTHPEIAGGLQEIDHFLEHTIVLHVGEIAEILFFLLGAMTIVELVDAHEGFNVVTKRIRTNQFVPLMWILCLITFFFSAVLDNLTTSIVMATLLKKLMTKKEDLWFFAGMIVIAANAGGAWSPIGDVTTIMLWISGQVTAANIIVKVFLPGLVCLLVPLAIISFDKRGNVSRPEDKQAESHEEQLVTGFEQQLIFWMGIGGLLFVPVFKNLTHLPPFMGMLFSLGILWITTEVIHRHKPAHHKNGLSVAGVIQRIDTPSVLFFLGILLAVACLQTAGHLGQLAAYLENTFGNIYIINILVGLLSAVVDNVPLVAGAIGMYPLSTYPTDHTFWELLAYCAGTGGSALIIGSAAGVAIMGILKIDFLWYMRKISWLAVLGYFAGVLVYWLMNG